MQEDIINKANLAVSMVLRKKIVRDILSDYAPFGGRFTRGHLSKGPDEHNTYLYDVIDYLNAHFKTQLNHAEVVCGVMPGFVEEISFISNHEVTVERKTIMADICNEDYREISTYELSPSQACLLAARLSVRYTISLTERWIY